MKRTYAEMSATEQQILEDFDTGKSAKRYAKEKGKRLPYFCGKMW